MRSAEMTTSVMPPVLRWRGRVHAGMISTVQRATFRWPFQRVRRCRSRCAPPCSIHKYLGRTSSRSGTSSRIPLRKRVVSQSTGSRGAGPTITQPIWCSVLLRPATTRQICK